MAVESLPDRPSLGRPRQFTAAQIAALTVLPTLSVATGIPLARLSGTELVIVVTRGPGEPTVGHACLQRPTSPARLNT